MDSTISTQMASVQEVYENLIRDSSLLAQGPAVLEHALNSIPNFAEISLKIFVSNHQSHQVRIYIGALFKSILTEHWHTNANLASQKKEIRETLLHGLIMNVGDLKIIESIALMITIIMAQDGVDLWANSLKEIIEWMPSDDHSIIDTGLELFCTIFAKISEKCRSEKLLPETFSLAPIIPKLMLSLYNIFSKTDLSENQREKVLVLLYLTVSSFAYADGSDNKLVSACLDETFKTWMGLFVSALSTNPKTHIPMKRYILKILNVIFRDFTYYTRDAIAPRIVPIWKFLNTILPLYIWTSVYGIPLSQLDANIQPISDPSTLITQNNQQQQMKTGNEDLDERFLEEEDEHASEIEGLAINAIELVSTLVTKDSLYILMKQAVYPIVNALAHFILLTRDQERLWVNEPNQFVSDDDDESNMKTQRSLVHSLIFQLIERFGDQTTQALMIVAEKFMMNYDEAHTTQVIKSFYDKLSNNDFKLAGGSSMDFSKEKLMEFVRTSSFDCTLAEHAWKKREVGLLLLGSFSDDIIDFQYKHTSSFDITSLIKNLIADIQSQQNVIPILVAKSLWCVSRFSEIIGSKTTQLFLPLFQVTATCLAKTHQFPVRLTATKAIGIFAHKIIQYQDQLPNRSEWTQFGVEDTSVLNEIFDVFNHVNIDTVHIILDTLVYLNKLSPAYIPVVASLGARSILQIFTLQHSDHMVSKIIIELITQLAENPVSFDFIFSNAFAAFIVDSFLLIKHHTLENPSLSQIKPQDISLMASIFDVTSIFVRNCKDKHANENLIALLPPLLSLMALNEENTLQQHASICLKDFLKISSPFIIQNNLVKDVLQVIMKLLQVPSNSQLESSSTYAGNLCMIAFNNLLGGSADPEILKQLVFKVFRSKLATTVQGLILVWARMIINNAAESVNFLCSFSVENRQALKILIDKWLLQQPVFRGKHTKHATFLALTKLFLLKDKRIENLIAIAYNPSHSNIGNDVSAPFKIFSTLIRGLDNEMAPLRRDKDSTQEYLSGEKDERLDAEDGDSDYDENAFKDEAADKIEVDLGIIQDEDDGDIQRRFAVGENKAGGLGEFETGSTNYMTEGFAFGYDDGEECDETTEEDLVYLKEEYLEMDTVEMLKKFFNDLTKTDPKYFAECLKHLLKEDIDLLSKYVSLKNLDALHLEQEKSN